MSNEVKRWYLRQPLSRPNTWFASTIKEYHEGYSSCVEVMRVEDHERVVDQKDAWDRKRIEHIDELQDTIATQKRVIVILTQQRNVAHERARVNADEMMQFIQEDDAEIAAIEKGEA